MLRIVIAASLLSGALGDYYSRDRLNSLIAKGNGQRNVPCQQICSELFGTSRYNGGWRTRGGKAITNCKCKQKWTVIAQVTVTCSRRSGKMSNCRGSQTSGKRLPRHVQESDPSCLSEYIAKCAEARNHKYAQRDGTITTQKVKRNVGDAQCSDLAFGCITNANKNGFNVGHGKRGHEYGMGGSWAWSRKKIHYTQAKRGDIAQFSSWRESAGGHSRSTGRKHTAVIIADYAKCAIKTLDQNPRRVHVSVYHPCRSAGHRSGKLIVYRLTSRLVGSSGSNRKYCSGDAHSAPAPAPAPASAQSSWMKAHCPLQCKTCKPGSKSNGGVALVGGTCHEMCSKKYGAARYCGKGSSKGYISGDAIYCGGCAGCKDDNAGIVEFAEAHKSKGDKAIHGCADVQPYCNHRNYGPIVKKYCPETCKICPAPARLDEDFEGEYDKYTKELQQENEGEDSSKSSSLMLLVGASTAAMLVGMAGYGMWRKARTPRHVALIQTEEDGEMSSLE